MFFCEHTRQILHYLRVLVSRRLNDAHKELRRNTEPKDAVNEGSHYFQMEKGLKQLLEIMMANVHNLDI
jgi:hypothetical protein